MMRRLDLPSRPLTCRSMWSHPLTSDSRMLRRPSACADRILSLLVVVSSTCFSSSSLCWCSSFSSCGQGLHQHCHVSLPLAFSHPCRALSPCPHLIHVAVDLVLDHALPLVHAVDRLLRQLERLGHRVDLAPTTPEWTVQAVTPLPSHPCAHFRRHFHCAPHRTSYLPSWSRSAEIMRFSSASASGMHLQR